MPGREAALRIAGGRLVDPASGLDAVKDLFIDKGRVVAVGRAPKGFTPRRVLDASGCLVLPGLVDLAARLREPGAEQKATIDSETRAAAAGGVTTLCLPPDTQPVIDSPAVVELIHQRAEAANRARVLCLGALTHRLAGERLAEMATLAAIGCVGVSNATQPIADSALLRRALEYAATVGLAVYLQPEDAWLAAGGLVHEGPVGSRLGLTGIPVSAETVALARDLLLIEHAGARAHVCRLSCGESVGMLRQAQRQGLPVSADVSIQQLTLCDTDVEGYDASRHLRPPLRSHRDRERLRKGVASGVIAAICSDHQPQDADSKSGPFAQTAPGASALETWLPLTWRLVEREVLTLGTAVAAVTSNPARILGVDGGRLEPGAPADVCVFDPSVVWEVRPEALVSAGRNTPYAGRTLHGRVRFTVYAGRVVHEA